MALNAGAAYITVRPDMRGFSSGVTKGMGGIAPVGAKAGQSLGGRMAGAAGTALKRGLQVSAAGAAGAAGMALVKGFGRLKALEEAEAKLSGLGHSAKSVDDIMKNALNSVKGTAFGMDEAASTAAGAVAAGVKPGKELESTLKLVADAATIGGSSMGEMGAIFNKVATSNKVQGEVIAQLGDRGIPVVQMLAKEMGVSGEQVMELSRQGKIGFDEFRGAMESGLGGAAQESGKTLSGAFKNTQASLGRIGANLLSGVYPQVQKFFTGAIGFLSGFEDKAATVGDKVGRFLSVGIESVSDGFRSFWSNHGERVKASLEAVATAAEFLWGSVLKPLGSWMLNNKQVVATFAGVILTIAAAVRVWAAIQAVLNAVLVANPVGLVVVALAALAAGLVYAYRKSETFQKIVNAAWGAVRAVVGAAWKNVIQPALSAMSRFLTQKVAPAFRAIGRVVGVVMRKVILPALRLWWRYITKVLVPIIRFLWSKVVKPVFRFIGTAVEVAWRVVGVALRAWVSYLKRFVFPVLRFLWDKVVKPVFSSLSAFIKRSWENVIRPVFAKLGSFINGTVRPAFRRGVDAIKSIWDGLKAAARAPVEFLVNTVYMKGIRAMMNKIPGVSLPSASFADGGWTGPGGRLTPAGIVHADEFVVTKASRRRVERRHPGLLDHLNNYGRLPGYASGGTVMPLAGARMGTYPGHDGVDLNVGSGWDDYRMPVRAFRSGGSISYTGWGRGYGLAIFHRGPWGEVVYGHNDSTSVRAGQSVVAGQTIGRVGNTGNSSAPHVHFGYPGGSYQSAVALLRGARSVSGSAGPGGTVRPNPGKEEKRSILDALKAIPKLARIAWSGMNSMGSRFGPWGSEFAKGARSAYRSGVNWGDDKIPDKIVVKNFPDVNMPDNPIRALLSKAGLYDAGGWLKPGHFAYNGSRRPEPVFSDAQWSLLRNTAAATSRVGVGVDGGVAAAGRERFQLLLDAQGREQLTGYVSRIADDRIGTHGAHYRAVGGRR